MVSENGTVRALRTGFSQIIARDHDGNEAYCDIVIIDNYNRTTVQSIRLSAEMLLLSAGEKFQLTAEFFPRDYFDNGALNTKIVWSSEDQDIAAIDKQGVVTAKKKGTATIIAKTEDIGRVASCTVKVQDIAKEETRLDTQDYTGLACIGNPYLYNVHVPSETITANSLNILWNRLSWIDLKQKCSYEVSYREKDCNLIYHKKRTNMLGYTLNNLKPNTEYEIRVTAWSESEENLAEETLYVYTATKETVCLNVCEAPYYAAGDGTTMDTRAIQRAINECPIGGTVYLPSHKVFLTGALFLKSNMVLEYK